MNEVEQDEAIRQAAFEHVRRLSEVHAYLSSADLNAGFAFRGDRIPLVNPQRGIFKPRQLKHLLSIRTVFPRPGGRVWYDDQREVHRQIFDEMESVDYAFMGSQPESADNRWLREAMQQQIPVIYFLGIAPGRYQAIVPTYVIGWDANTLKGTHCVRNSRSARQFIRRSSDRTPVRPSNCKAAPASSFISRSRY